MACSRDAILRGIMQSLASRVFTSILQFVTIVVLARGLGPDSLGVAQFMFVLFTYLILFSDPGLTVLGTREYGRSSSRLTEPGTLLGARLVLAIPLVAVIILVAAVQAGRSDSGLPAAAILVLGTLVSTLSLRWLLQARHSFGVVAICELLAALLQLAAALTVAVANLGAVAGLAVLVGGPLLVAILSHVGAVVSGGPVRPTVSRDGLRLIRLALPLGIAAFATAVYYSADSLLLGLTRSSGEVGIYAAAYRIVLAGLALPVIVHGVALPVIAKTLDTDPEATHRVVRGLSGWLMLMAFPAAAAVTLLAPGLIELIYGEPFAPSAIPLAILVWSLVTVSANVPFAVLVLASRRDRAYLGVTVLGALVNVTLNLFLIPAYGYVGAAFTTLAAEITVLASFVWLTRPLSVMTLRRTIPVGLVTAAAVTLPIVVWHDALVGQLALAAAGFATSVLVLSRMGALREPIAMLGRPSR